MDNLARRLQSLKLESGHADVQARKDELKNLMLVLSHFEIRDLRAELNKITMDFDICAELPIELVILIADHLDLEDILRARSVSHAWNRTFSSPDFCLGIIAKHFPSTWQHEYISLKPQARVDAKLQLQAWLQPAILNRLRRQNGKYQSMAFYPLTMTSPRREERAQYCNGRIAFKVSNSSFMVKSLRTGCGIIYTDENRTTMNKWWLGDQYLIAESSRGTILWAWELKNTSSQPCHVRLPSMVDSLSARGSHVGILTSTEEAFLWKLPHSIKALDTPRPAEGSRHRSSRKRILFPPHDSSRLFITSVVYYLDENSEIISHGCLSAKLVVHDFQITLEPSITSYVATYTTELDTSSLAVRKQIDSMAGLLDSEALKYLKWAKSHFIDETTIGFWSLDSTCPLRPSLNTGADNQLYPLIDPSDNNTTHVYTTAFNIMTKKFQSECYKLRLPKYLLNLDENHNYALLSRILIWRQQIHFPTLIYSLAGLCPPNSLANLNTTILIAIAPTSQPPPANPIIPWYSSTASSPPPPPYNHQTTSSSPDSSLKFGYYVASEIKNGLRRFETKLPFSRVGNRDIGTVQGDDDFLVEFGSEAVAVWCFDTNAKLPDKALWREETPALT